MGGARSAGRLLVLGFALAFAADSRAAPQMNDAEALRTSQAAIGRTVGGVQLRLAGGENAYAGTLAYPTVSAEGILQMDPDAVIEMAPGLAARGLSPRAVAREWAAAPGLRAAAEGRIHVLTNDYVQIPGPRFVLTLERMARVLHPEADWDGAGAAARPGGRSDGGHADAAERPN